MGRLLFSFDVAKLWLDGKRRNRMKMRILLVEAFLGVLKGKTISTSDELG